MTCIVHKLGTYFILSRQFKFHIVYRIHLNLRKLFLPFKYRKLSILLCEKGATWLLMITWNHFLKLTTQKRVMGINKQVIGDCSKLPLEEKE